MEDKARIRISKYLSKHLRHSPEAIGLELRPGGWVTIDDLLSATKKHGFTITRTQLDEVVAKCEKQRFALDETATLIRANQGHSTVVDLQLEPASPPSLLYHGTPVHTLDTILAQGLKKMSRHHVHLSPTTNDARKVGQRRGKPVILLVDSEAMAQDGHTFYCSANGVWLVDEVPAKYIRVE